MILLGEIPRRKALVGLQLVAVSGIVIMTLLERMV